MKCSQQISERMSVRILITDADDKAAYKNTKKIASESEFSDKYYNNLAEFASLLDDKKSYVRVRAMILCCSQARWDTEGQLSFYLPRMLRLLHDEKPTVVRQSLNALKEVVVFRPELSDTIERELNRTDTPKYKDSMLELIRKDIAELSELIKENEK